MLLLYVFFHPLLFFISNCIPVWPSLYNFLLVEWKSLKERKHCCLLDGEVWRVVLGCIAWKKESEQTHSSWADCAYTLPSCYVLRRGFASINLSWFGRINRHKSNKHVYYQKQKFWKAACVFAHARSIETKKMNYWYYLVCWGCLDNAYMASEFCSYWIPSHNATSLQVHEWWDVLYRWKQSSQMQVSLYVVRVVLAQTVLF